MSARRRPVRVNRDAGAVSAAAALEDDDYSGDVVRVHYRFSIVAVCHFVDQLSEEQQEVVRSIGFEGVLHLTGYKKLDRHFSAWLCNQLELVTAAAAPGASASAPVPLFLKDGAGEKVPVTARDVHEVLGIPNGERQVGLARNSTEKESDAAAVRRALGLDPGEAPTLQLAEAVIARTRKDAPSAGPMTQPERDAFVVAFLLLLVEHFLAPGPPVGRRGKVNEEVFHAVTNPSEVHLYDWAEYVLEEFRRCAGRVQRQVSSRCSNISLSGCLLFLQIFYLDRLDLETTNGEVPCDVLPRVAAYNDNSLHNAIELDRQPEWPEGSLKLFGKLKFAVKQAAQTDDFGSTSMGPQPYLHSCDSEQHDSTKNTDMLSTMHGIEQYVKRHVIEELNRFFKINCSGLQNKQNKGENHQPLAHDQHLPDAAEGTNTVNVHSYSGKTAPCVQAELKTEELPNNLQQITQQGVPSKKRSRSKEASPSTEKKPAVQVTSCQTHPDSPEDLIEIDRETFLSSTLGSCPANPTPRSGHLEAFANLKPRTTQEVPLERTSPLELADRNGARCESHPDMILGASPSSEVKSVTQETPCQTAPACAPSCSGPKMKKEYIFGRSPFEMGLVHPEPPLEKAKACFKWLEACSYQDDQLNWTWVILEEPNSIAVKGLPIKYEMIPGAALKQDVCNLVMRLYRQLDDEIYQKSGKAEPRWRHFLPAEWSSSALELGDKIREPSPTVRSMFTGAHIAYDVGLCRMVIAPVELDGSWSCYAWDFKEKRLNILDPLLRRSRSGRKGRNEEAIKMKHSSSAPQLLNALLVCLSLYCNSHGYDHQESSPNSWKTEFLHDFEGMHSRCQRNTGMYTLFYAREFDGKGMRQTVSERTIQSLRRDLLHQMLTMRGNTGRPPMVVDYPAKCPP